MDQVVIDCGSQHEVHVGDEVVFLGEQGDDRIVAADWAELLGDSSYTVPTGVSSRVPRRYLP